MALSQLSHAVPNTMGQTRKGHLTCTNAILSQLSHEIRVPHPCETTRREHKTAGQSVIHRQNLHGADRCPKPLGTAPDLRKRPTVPTVDNSHFVTPQRNSRCPTLPLLRRCAPAGTARTTTRRSGPPGPSNDTSQPHERTPEMTDSNDQQQEAQR